MALGQASLKGYRSIVELLLEYGLDPEAGDCVALDKARENYNWSIVEILTNAIESKRKRKKPRILVVPEIFHSESSQAETPTDDLMANILAEQRPSTTETNMELMDLLAPSESTII